MPELILTILKLCLLALLYLFFLRVLRAVWVEVRSEGADVAPRAGSGAGSTRRRSARERSGATAKATAGRAKAGRRRGPARGQQARQGAPAPAGAAVAATGSAAPAGSLASGSVRGAPQDIVVTDETGRRSAPIVIGSLVTVGRAESCEIRITDSFASQMHARVFDNDGVVYLEDLNSTNGTFLNEAKVRGTAPLHSGDVIQIGNTTLGLQ